MRKIKILSLAASLICAAPLINAQDEADGTLYLFPEGVGFGAALQVLSESGMNSSGSYFVDRVGFAPTVWDLEAGIIPLGEATQSGGRVNGISDDGTIAGGQLSARAYRWVVGSSGAQLLNEDGSPFLGEVFVVSGDGTVLAGTRNDGSGNNVPFMWTEANGIASLPMVDGYINAAISGISTDGSIIAGSISNSAAETISAIWTNGALKTIDAPGANFVRIIDLLPDGSKALIDTGGVFTSPPFIYDVETEERTTLVPNDFVSSFTRSTDFSESDGYVVMVRRNLGTPQQRQDTAFALEVDATGTVVEELNFQQFVIDTFNLNPDETRINQVKSIRGDERFVAGDINLESGRFAYVLDLEGAEGVVNLTLPNDDGDRFAVLIDNSTIIDQWVVGSWFKDFYVGFFAESRWIYHAQFEWLYVAEDSGDVDGFWFYSDDLQQWIYTAPESFPWIYLSSDGIWQLTQ